MWLFIIVALFIQEPASTDAAIFQARHLGLNLWIVHGIWFIATCIDIWGGYQIGKWIQAKYGSRKFGQLSQRWAQRVGSFIGRRGEKFVLVLLGIINFPWLNSFLASWLAIPFRNLFLLIFAGDAVYWGIAWAINLGLREVVTDPHLALYAIVGAGLLFSIISKTILERVLKD